MSLEPGTRVGHYEIQRPIGKGGMGEVYRAVDTRLGRTVAIKILTPGAQQDDDRLARFEQEARTVGALNHPNLLTLYDVGRHDGAPYLVTELLTGMPLRTRLERDGALPVPEALRIAAEIARGLAAAHALDIVHRDIKPDNLFITTDQRIKILDFGVAKLQRALDKDAGKEANAALRDTAIEMPYTVEGAVIGTPGYMSPEQLQGDPIDRRTDVFSLGVVLFEMLEGKRPFAAPTTIEESYAVLKQPAPGLTIAVSPAIDRLIKRCLEKTPDARFQSASDLAFALAALDLETSAARHVMLAAITPPRAEKPVAVPAKRPRWLAGAGIGVVIAGALVAGRALAPAGSASNGATTSPALAWPALPHGGPKYRRVTFDSTECGRFVKGSIVHTRGTGGLVQVVQSSIDSLTSRTLAAGYLRDAAETGDLLLTRTFRRSTLQRLHPDRREASRDLATDVADASFGPGADLVAVVRKTSAGFTVEHPPGKVIASSPSRLANVRVSRDGRHVAFVESAGMEQRGRVHIVGREGARVRLSNEYSAVLGLAWSPDGTAVWFGTPSRDPASNAIRALPIAGDEQLLLRMALFPSVCDVAEDGRILIAPREVRIRQYTMARTGMPVETSWYDGTVVQGVSADGKTIVFVEGLETASRDGVYAAFQRTGDATRSIGHAHRLTVLPDASAVIEIAPNLDKLVRRSLIDPGAQPIELPAGTVQKLDADDHLEVAWRSPHVVFRADGRLWIQRIDGGSPRAIGPAAVPADRHPVSPDGAWVAIRDESAGIRLLSTTGEQDRVLPAPNDETPIGFTADGTSLFVLRRGAPRIIERVELASGKRMPWATVPIPRDSADLFFAVRLDATGDTIVYSTATVKTELFVIEPP